MPKVKLTINPDKEVEVDEATYQGLKFQGLVVGEDKSVNSNRDEVPVSEASEKENSGTDTAPSKK